MSRSWGEVAPLLRERVRAACWDSLAGQLVQLHRPHVVEGEPVCQGCDRRLGEGDDDPTWPCRTYTIIAGTLLGLPDVEAALTAMQG